MKITYLFLKKMKSTIKKMKSTIKKMKSTIKKMILIIIMMILTIKMMVKMVYLKMSLRIIEKLEIFTNLIVIEIVLYILNKIYSEIIILNFEHLMKKIYQIKTRMFS